MNLCRHIILRNIVHVVTFVICAMVKVDKSKQYLRTLSTCLPRSPTSSVCFATKASVCIATKATTSITKRSLTLQAFKGQMRASVMIKQDSVEQYLLRHLRNMSSYFLVHHFKIRITYLEGIVHTNHHNIAKLCVSIRYISYLHFA